MCVLFFCKLQFSVQLAATPPSAPAFMRGLSPLEAVTGGVRIYSPRPPFTRPPPSQARGARGAVRISNRAISQNLNVSFRHFTFFLFCAMIKKMRFGS